MSNPVACSREKNGKISNGSEKTETRVLKEEFWNNNLTQEFLKKKLERGILKHKIRNKIFPTGP